MKNKPVRFGVKLWIWADSLNGCTIDFNICVGKEASKRPSDYGVSYDVVMELREAEMDQGYQVYLDIFYTSRQLVHDLNMRKTPSVGVVKVGGKRFPMCLKNVKVWVKTGSGVICGG